VPGNPSGPPPTRIPGEGGEKSRPPLPFRSGGAIPSRHRLSSGGGQKPGPDPGGIRRRAPQPPLPKGYPPSAGAGFGPAGRARFLIIRGVDRRPRADREREDRMTETKGGRP